MSTKKNSQVPASDRSMEPEREARSELFFFPKRNPPVTIRAASREEAERLLEDPNPQEV